MSSALIASPIDAAAHRRQCPLRLGTISAAPNVTGDDHGQGSLHGLENRVAEALRIGRSAKTFAGSEDELLSAPVTMRGTKRTRSPIISSRARAAKLGTRSVVVRTTIAKVPEFTRVNASSNRSKPLTQAILPRNKISGCARARPAMSSRSLEGGLP